MGGNQGESDGYEGVHPASFHDDNAAAALANGMGAVAISFSCRNGDAGVV